MSKTVAAHVMDAFDRKDPGQILVNATRDAVASGGVLPGVMPLSAALDVFAGVWASMPDFRCDVLDFDVEPDKVIARCVWGGTHSRALDLSAAGLPVIGATGQPVWVEDVLVFEFRWDRVASLGFDSPDAGGVAGMLAQLGVVYA